MDFFDVSWNIGSFWPLYRNCLTDFRFHDSPNIDNYFLILSFCLLILVLSFNFWFISFFIVDREYPFSIYNIFLIYNKPIKIIKISIPE